MVAKRLEELGYVLEATAEVFFFFVRVHFV